ncbi:hypothetical protein D3C73_1507380 [compost metagenome]
MRSDLRKFAAQQEMHVKPGPRQHQAIKAADGTTANNANAWFARVHADLLINVGVLFYTC